MKNLPNFQNCRCGMTMIPNGADRSEVEDLGLKLSASIILSDRSKRIVVPSPSEMIGVYLLERDDELPNRKRLPEK